MYEAPDGKGHLVQDPRFYAALRADRELQDRKFGRRGKGGKGRAQIKPTISPSPPPHRMVVEVSAPMEADGIKVHVERRSIDVYERLGGQVQCASVVREAHYA